MIKLIETSLGDLDYVLLSDLAMIRKTTLMSNDSIHNCSVFDWCLIGAAAGIAAILDARARVAAEQQCLALARGLMHRRRQIAGAEDMVCMAVDLSR